MKKTPFAAALFLFLASLIAPALLTAADVTVRIDAEKVTGVMKKEIFGQNMAIWEETENGKDAEFNELMKAMEGFQVRYPGGGYADLYAWDTMGKVGSAAWTKSNEDCISFVRSFGGELQPCVNFSGYWNDTQHSFEETLKKAVAWVQLLNIDNKMGVRYWEIGNEQNQPAEKGNTTGDDYGKKFVQLSRAMKAVDPSIKIGLQASPYDDKEGATWTKLAMTECKKAGVIPEFLIVHEYPNRTSKMSPATDAGILQRSLADIKAYTANLDSMVKACFGAEYVGRIKYWMTEYRSSLGNFLQNLTFVDALFTAQYIMEMVKYQWEGANIWDIKNGIDAATGGDFGIVSVAWRFEAEAGTRSGGASTAKTLADASGGQYVTGFTAAGAGVSLYVTMASAEEAAVTVSYNNPTGADQTLSVLVNDAKAGTLVLLPVKGRTWAQARVKVKMKKGFNTLTLKSEKAAGAVAIDYLSISGAVPEIEGFRMPAYNNSPRPVFYVFPFLSSKLFKNTVDASSNNPLVSAYAGKDDKGNVSLLLVNNSFTADLVTGVEVSGMKPGIGTDGEAWIMEGAGLTPAGVSEPIQQRADVRVNGVVHPSPISLKTMAGVPLTVGKSFAVRIPRASLTVVKIPAAAEASEKMEAEDSLYSPGLYIASDAASYSGDGFLTGFKDNPGAQATFYVKSVIPGSCKITVRYRNPEGGDQRMGLYLDKNRVATLKFPAVTSGASWAEASTTVELAEGSNAVVLKRDPGDGWVDVDCVAVSAPALERFEAEKAALSGGAEAATDHKGYSGSGFVAGYYDRVGATTKFTLTADKTGPYRVVLSYANSMGTTQKISLYVNGKDTADVSFPNLLDWDTWSMKFIPVNLVEGTNTIAFVKDAGDGCINLDYVSLVAAAPGQNLAGTKYEAEDQELAHGAWAPKNRPDASGASYVEGWYGNIGASITFHIAVEKAGTHKVTLHYANAMGSEQKMSVYVNGKSTMDVTYPNHSSWTSWYDDVQEIDLGAGDNTIMFRSDPGDGCINFDYILVE